MPVLCNDGQDWPDYGSPSAKQMLTTIINTAACSQEIRDAAFLCRKHFVHGKHCNKDDAGRYADVAAAYAAVVAGGCSDPDVALVIIRDLNHGGGGGKKAKLSTHLVRLAKRGERARRLAAKKNK